MGPDQPRQVESPDTSNSMTANGACGKAVFVGGSIRSISGSCVGDSVYYSVGYGGALWG